MPLVNISSDRWYRVSHLLSVRSSVPSITFAAAQQRLQRATARCYSPHRRLR
jgi:hypothetical protein